HEMSAFLHISCCEFSCLLVQVLLGITTTMQPVSFRGASSFQRLGRFLSSSVLVTVMRMLPLFIVSQKIGASSRFQNKNLLTHIPRVYYMRLHQQQSKFFPHFGPHRSEERPSSRT